jgi:ABC-type hemin transport system ATPase subunit
MGLLAMGPAIFLIAILGCGEGDSPCQQVRTLEARYESQAACTAATEAAVTQNSDVDFPVVVAECIASGAKPNAPKAGEIQRPGPGQADVRVSPLRS